MLGEAVPRVVPEDVGEPELAVRVEALLGEVEAGDRDVR
jgi:hypothetical protein